MMQQGVTFFYRLFEFFDSEQIATRDGVDMEEMKYNNASLKPKQGSNNNDDDDEIVGITLFEDFTPNCAVSGAGVICFGDNDGWVKFINRDFQIFKFKSHSERIQKLFKTPSSDILIALGKHVDIPNGPVETFIHIWKLSDIDELGNPKKIKSFRLFPESQMEYVMSYTYILAHIHYLYLSRHIQITNLCINCYIIRLTDSCWLCKWCCFGI